MAHRLLVIGLDGATFDVLRPAMASGSMPNLAALMEKGCSAVLNSTVPPVTPVAWTSFMTGKNPGKHGIFDFRLFNRETHSDSFANATHIRARTLWQLLSEMGLVVGVLNLPMTYPPQKVNGFILSGFDTPSTNSAFAYPAELRNELLQRFPHYDFIPSWGVDAHFSLDKFRSFTQAISDAFAMRTEAALYLIERFRPDVFMVQFQNLDVFQHKAWGYLAPAAQQTDAAAPYSELSLDCLRKLDANIGRLLAHDQFADANVLVVSDHGFGNMRGFIHANDFLEAWGYLARERPSQADPPQERLNGWRNRLRHSSFRSVRLLYRQLGRWRWQWRYRRKHKSTWLENTRSAEIERELPVVWEKTTAVVGMAEIYGLMQVFGNQAERAMLRQELGARFLELSDPQSGERLFADVVDASHLYRGPYADRVDLVLIPADGWTVVRRFAEREPIVRSPNALAGTHRPQGVLIAAGPGIRPDSPLLTADLTDMTPTILHLLGGTVPDDMDGRVLTEILREIRPVIYSQTSIRDEMEAHCLSVEEAQELENRLKALGYLG